MDEAKKMTPVEEFKNWWLKHEDEIVGWVFIGAVTIGISRLSYKIGYVRGVQDLSNAFVNLMAEHNS